MSRVTFFAKGLENFKGEIMSFLTATQTPAEKLNTAIIGGAQTMFHVLSSAVTTWFHEIWNNPDQVNLSPDKAWAALGVNAVAVRTSFGGLVAFINAAAPGALTLAEPTNWTLTQNQDGSILAVKSS